MLYKVKAIVLGGKSIAEADKIITLYTRERGKIRVIAKGIRKTKSKFGSSLELFGLSNLLIYTKSPVSPKSGLLDIIRDCEIEVSHRRLREDLSNFAYASFICELVDKMTEEGPHGDSRIFYLLKQFLGVALDCEYSDKQKFLDYSLYSFFFRFFGIMGYKPSTDRCALCGSQDIFSKNNLGFSVSEGGLLCEPCKKKKSGTPDFSFPSLQYLKKLVAIDVFSLKNLKITQVHESEIRNILKHYFDFYLQKKMKSLSFLERMREA